MQFQSFRRLINSCRIAALAGVTAIGLSGTALAGSLHDHVYADSFGNLIVYSPGGYKRIIVGEGHMARQLSEYTRAGQPEVVYLDKIEGRTRCYSPPVLWKGRDRMYGLPDHVVPTPPVYCD